MSVFFTNKESKCSEYQTLAFLGILYPVVLLEIRFIYKFKSTNMNYDIRILKNKRILNWYLLFILIVLVRNLLEKNFKMEPKRKSFLDVVLNNLRLADRVYSKNFEFKFDFLVI